MSLSRRQFLIGAGGLAAAAAAGGFASVERLSDHSAGVSPTAASLRKCISLGGPGPLRQDDHPDDYRLWGNREYIRDLSGTTWVKLWVSWCDLQQELGVSPADAEDAGDEAARRGQADAIVQSFERMRGLPDVYMWTQHTVSDKPGNNFKGGLRDDFRWSEGPGTRRPSWYAWRDLSG